MPGCDKASALPGQVHGIPVPPPHQVPGGAVVPGNDAIVVAQEQGSRGVPQKGVNVPRGHRTHGSLGQGEAEKEGKG